jgi:hypothetical protein
MVVDVREQPRDQNEVDRAAADHLIGDVDIAALRVPDRRKLHEPSVSKPLGAAATPRPARSWREPLAEPRFRWWVTGWRGYGLRRRERPMRPRERRTTIRLSCLATLIASLWAALVVAAALSSGPSAEASIVASSTSTLEPGTVPDPLRAVPSAASGLSDADTNVLPTPTPSISDVTDPISDAIGDATDAVSGTASAAAGTASGTTGGATARGVGPAAPAGAQRSTRGGQNASGCASGACDRPDSGSSLGQTVERILGFLAETGSTLLPWIALAVGLGALGVLLLRASRRRSSRT